MIQFRFQFTCYTFDFHFFYNALLYFQTVDIFLLIPLFIETIYIESTNKIRFLLNYMCLFKQYRSRYSPKSQGCVKETRSITPNQSLSQYNEILRTKIKFNAPMHHFYHNAAFKIQCSIKILKYIFIFEKGYKILSYISFTNGY